MLLSCQFFIVDSFATDKVREFRVEMSTLQCERLIPQVFATSANYYEGLDVQGRAVVPADGGQSQTLNILPKIVTFNMSIDFSKYSGELGKKLGSVGLTTSNQSYVDRRGEFLFTPERELNLSSEETEKLTRINNEIKGLELYEQELVWTRKAILGNSLELAENLVRLQEERKKINQQIERQHKSLEREKKRVIQATGGENETNQGMLSLRKRQIKNVEAEFYYGEDYLTLQRSLSVNSDAQERAKKAMSLRDQAESEGEQKALLINEKALTKTRASLEKLRKVRKEIVKEPLTSGNTVTHDREENLPPAPYGLSKSYVGGLVRVEYDLSRGLLTLNGYPLEPVEITQLIDACRKVQKN